MPAALRISDFLGFGWLPVATLAVCGLGVHYLNGAAAGLLYVPLLLAAIYMAARFRLYRVQPWRRAHARAMAAFGELAGAEYDAARRAGREYDIAAPCAALAARLFGGADAREAAALLLDENRKSYYKRLAREFPQVFLQGVPEARRQAVLEGIDRDIETSRLGPDILIARSIELQHSRAEAANYLRALMLGRVR
ncbi:MAG: hypothetical protein LBS70_07680 [Candidatus Accumulibacter sp.]|jgi:hypothetical protein|nr:hypothetical protein [Accumulibacter sp.]